MVRRGCVKPLAPNYKSHESGRLNYFKPGNLHSQRVMLILDELQTTTDTRRLAAIMFTDIVGFSTLSHQNEVLVALELMAA